MGSALQGPDSSIQRDNLNIQHGLQRGRSCDFPFFRPSRPISPIMVPTPDRLSKENGMEVSNPREAWYNSAGQPLGKGGRLWLRSKPKRTLNW